MDNLPPEIICDVANFVTKPDLMSLAATSHRMESILACKTWQKVSFRLRQENDEHSIDKVERPFKVVTPRDVDKFYHMIQMESVQANIRWIQISADKTSFGYAKRKDKWLPVELQNPSQLDQMLLHMIPAFCVRLTELVIHYPSSTLPVQISTLISRLQKHNVDVTFLLSEPHKTFKDKLKREPDEEYEIAPNIIETLTIECAKMEEKQLSGLVKHFKSLKVLTLLSLDLDLQSFKWAPESLVHLQIEFRSPTHVRKSQASTLPNLRSLRVSGKFPNIENVLTPRLRTLWVSRVNMDAADFIRERRITDLIISSDLSMPLWVAADPANLCPSVKTLVLYGISNEATILGFIKLLPNLSQVLCYLSHTFVLEELKFKRLLLRKLCQSTIKAMYVCAPHWEYKTHEHRINSKRLVMLSFVEFFQKLGYTTLESFRTAITP